MTFASRIAALVFAATISLAMPASAQQRAAPNSYGPDELVGAGHRFFGSVSRGLASVIERAVSQWGLPNGYVLGEEGSGAFVAGLRYGEGTLYTKNAGDLRVYWQGPSVGFDFGGNASKCFTLVYAIRRQSEIYQRFPGVEGSAYFIGGLGVNYQRSGRISLAPIRAGVGFRTGVNVGYLSYTRDRDILPF